MLRRLTILALLIAAPAQARETPTSRYLTATSPDGRYRAEISTMRPVYDCGPDGEGDSDNVEHVLELTDLKTGKRDAVFVGVLGVRIYDANPAFGDPWGEDPLFGSPKFSPDGRAVYVVMRNTTCDTQTWRDKPRVYRLDFGARVERFIVTGRLLSIVRDGPRAGYLLVQQQGTGRADPVLLVSPIGETVLTIPGSERTGRAALAPWLKAKGWGVY